MKKLLIVFSLLCFSAYAQEAEKEMEWIVFPSFNMYYTSFLNTGNTMTQDSHRNYASGFGFKLGVVAYKNMGLALFYNYARNKINDVAMIADFNHTKYYESGLIFSYQIPLTEKTRLKPEIGYYATEVKNVGERRKAFYKGNGLLIGTEYLFFLNQKIAMIVGVHYNYLRFGMEANPTYKNYFANAHRIQFKIGFHFSR